MAELKYLAPSLQVAYFCRTAVNEFEVSKLVYKIVDEAEWGAAERTGSYRGSPDDLRDGFIHLSFADQIAGTAARHFRHRTGLLLVAFHADDLGGALKNEPSRDGALFPHLYGELPVSKAVRTEPMLVDRDGIPRTKNEVR